MVDVFTTHVPAGVDSLIAVQADSMLAGLIISVEDESTAERLKNQAIGLLESTESPGLNDLQRVEDLLSKSVELDPFDIEARFELAGVYQQLSAIDGVQNARDLAISNLEAILKLDASQFAAYQELASMAVAAEDWSAAVGHLDTATHALTDHHELQGQPLAPSDSTMLFEWAYLSSRAQAQLGEPDMALRNLEHARSWARTEVEQDDASGLERLIDWDDGNMESALLFDSLQSSTDSHVRAEGFAELEEIATTTGAKRVAAWQRAVAVYASGDEPAGLKMIRDVYQEQQQSPDAAVAQDSLWNDYGTMLLNRGITLGEEGGASAVVLAYFLQSLEVDWSERARAALLAVRLIRASPESAIRIGLQGLKYSPRPDVRMDLQSELFDLFVTMGRFDDAQQLRPLLVDDSATDRGAAE